MIWLVLLLWFALGIASAVLFAAFFGGREQ